jgi:uncharacterized protein HemX
MAAPFDAFVPPFPLKEPPMKSTTLTALLVLAATALAPAAWAGSQQEKMKTCNAEAKEKALSSDDRKAFMKECLSSKPADKKTSQQEKMKTCNAEAKAKALAGDDRSKFMKQCLSA